MQTHWDLELNSQNVNNNLEKFSNLIYTLYDECFPLATKFVLH